MPPKQVRKRKAAPSTDVATGKVPAQPVPNVTIDYTQLASEILRLQKVNSNSDVQEVQPGASLQSAEASFIQMSPPTSVTQPSTIQPAPTAAPSSSADASQSAANQVVSLLDKIFAGETAAGNRNDIYKPTDGIPLGASVSKQVKSKIWNNTFIELHTLLPGYKEDPLSVNIVPGTITLQQQTRKTELSINQWTSAFYILMAIYMEKNLQEAPHLLKYCEFIRELQRDHGDEAFRFYDKSFRQLREHYNYAWQTPVEELRGKAFSEKFRQKQNPSSTQSFDKKRFGNNMQPFRSSQRNTCYAFNRGETCIKDPCPYRHVCSYCKAASHKKIECFKYKNSTKTATNTNKPAPSPKPSSTNPGLSASSGKSTPRV